MNNSSTKQRTAGVFLSYVNIILGNLIPFFYTPVMLRLLGKGEYGLYKIAGSTASYLGLMAFGISSSVSRYLIQARTESGAEREQQVLYLFLKIFRVIAGLTILAGIAMVAAMGLLYGKSFSEQELLTARILVLILALNTAVSFTSVGYTAEISTHERFVFLYSVNVFTSVAVPLLTLIALWFGFGSVGMVTISLIISVACRIGFGIYVRSRLNLRPARVRFDGDYLKGVLKFSFWVFVASVVGQLYSSTDLIIIGAVPALATLGAAVYGVGYTFPNMLFSLAQVIPGVFNPMANRMVFEGSSNSELSDFVIRIGRLQAYAVVLVCSGFVAFGREFIALYAGPGYAEAYGVAVFIMIPDCIPLVQSAALSVLMAKNKHRFRSLVYLGIAVTNIIFTILLVNRYGILGAAIPTGVSYLLGQGIIMNLYYWKRLQLDIPRFWKSVLPIFLLGTVLCVTAFLLGHYWDYSTVGNLIAGIVIFSLAYLIVAWFGIATEEEKTLVKSIIRREI